ncbi:hypothetical protein [Mucilaginibacter sp. UYCu711]|uniref:hypothetical protein n=1 Tax=Mucilaginibacter sp. UYCu711 TaxID=3156339 RepID=UPI003D2292DD
MVFITDSTDINNKEQKRLDSIKNLKSVNKTLPQVHWSNSHELRGPICSILGLIQLLEFAETKQDYLEAFELIKQCAYELDSFTRENISKIL